MESKTAHVAYLRFHIEGYCMLTFEGTDDTTSPVDEKADPALASSTYRFAYQRHSLKKLKETLPRYVPLLGTVLFLLERESRPWEDPPGWTALPFPPPRRVSRSTSSFLAAGAKSRARPCWSQSSFPAQPQPHKRPSLSAMATTHASSFFVHTAAKSCV